MIDPRGQVTRKKRNQSTFRPTEERSANAQNIAMPMETISEHGIVRTSNAPNTIPKALLAGEEFRKFRTEGTANEKKDAKQIRHTTTDQRNSLDATFDSSHLNLINSPLV
jgi:hypothetical protein